MNAKEYLSRYKRVCQQITALSDEIGQLNALINRGVQHITGMPRGSAGNDWTDTVIKLAELKEDMARKYSEMCMVRAEIEKAIDAVEDADGQTLLRMRYLNGWSWNKIARAMNYSVDWLWALHRKTLTHVKDNSSQQ